MYVPPPDVELRRLFEARLAALVGAVQPRLTPLGRRIVGLSPRAPEQTAAPAPASMLQSALAWIGLAKAPAPACSNAAAADQAAAGSPNEPISPVIVDPVLPEPVVAFDHGSAYSCEQNGLFLGQA